MAGLVEELNKTIETINDIVRDRDNLTLFNSRELEKLKVLYERLETQTKNGVKSAIGNKYVNQVVRFSTTGLKTKTTKITTQIKSLNSSVKRIRNSVDLAIIVRNPIDETEADLAETENVLKDTIDSAEINDRLRATEEKGLNEKLQTGFEITNAQNDEIEALTLQIAENARPTSAQLARVKQLKERKKQDLIWDKAVSADRTRMAMSKKGSKKYKQQQERKRAEIQAIAEEDDADIWNNRESVMGQTFIEIKDEEDKNNVRIDILMEEENEAGLMARAFAGVGATTKAVKSVLDIPNELRKRVPKNIFSKTPKIPGGDYLPPPVGGERDFRKLTKQKIALLLGAGITTIAGVAYHYLTNYNVKLNKKESKNIFNKIAKMRLIEAKRKKKFPIETPTTQEPTQPTESDETLTNTKLRELTNSKVETPDDIIKNISSNGGVKLSKKRAKIILEEIRKSRARKSRRVEMKNRQSLNERQSLNDGRSEPSRNEGNSRVEMKNRQSLNERQSLNDGRSEPSRNEGNSRVEMKNRQSLNERQSLNDDYRDDNAEDDVNDGEDESKYPDSEDDANDSEDDDDVKYPDSDDEDGGVPYDEYPDSEDDGGGIGDGTDRGDSDGDDPEGGGGAGLSKASARPEISNKTSKSEISDIINYLSTGNSQVQSFAEWKGQRASEVSEQDPLSQAYRQDPRYIKAKNELREEFRVIIDPNTPFTPDKTKLNYRIDANNKARMMNSRDIAFRYTDADLYKISGVPSVDRYRFNQNGTTGAYQSDVPSNIYYPSEEEVANEDAFFRLDTNQKTKSGLFYNYDEPYFKKVKPTVRQMLKKTNTRELPSKLRSEMIPMYNRIQKNQPMVYRGPKAPSEESIPMGDKFPYNGYRELYERGNPNMYLDTTDNIYLMNGV
jgi:hypothetical protein